MLVSYNELPATSKVWIYQADRALSVEEVGLLNEQLEAFVADWKAHQHPVKGFGSMYYKRFLVLIADESFNDVSGCSIDSTVRLIKELEQAYNVNFFDRLKIAYKLTEQSVGAVSKKQLLEMLDKGTLSPETIVFNNLVQTKADFERNWEIPLKESWVFAKV